MANVRRSFKVSASGLEKPVDPRTNTPLETHIISSPWDVKRSLLRNLLDHFGRPVVAHLSQVFSLGTLKILGDTSTSAFAIFAS